jgi:hypothetical protein
MANPKHQDVIATAVVAAVENYCSLPRKPQQRWVRRPQQAEIQQPTILPLLFGRSVQQPQ